MDDAVDGSCQGSEDLMFRRLNDVSRKIVSSATHSVPRDQFCCRRGKRRIQSTILK
jgi:hypothetical protein